jgi:VIT1/CCC1 family predicted Fe2+/Mn2+ transporter
MDAQPVTLGGATEPKTHHSSLRLYLRNGKFLRSVVFGGVDGLTTSIVLICSTYRLVGRHSENQRGTEPSRAGKITATTLFVLGIANLAADAFSMGIGEVLGSMAEIDAASWSAPHRLNAAEDMARKFDALRNGAAMFLAFVLFGATPLWAYCPLLDDTAIDVGIRRFVASCVLGLASLFALGALRGLVTCPPTRGRLRYCVLMGLRMTLTGSVASIISFAISSRLHVGDVM